MTDIDLALPQRSSKPRRRGLTVVIDGGLPIGLFRDAVSSAAGYIDLVKFGWGTAVVTPKLLEKIAVLEEHGIGWFFGGTLFEVFVAQDRLASYVQLCRELGCSYMEVSNGTIHLPNAAKASYIERLAGEFHVLSEVGYKDADRSDALSADQWIEYIHQDLDAGATYTVTEARESGHSGICDASGALRFEIVEQIMDSDVDPDRLVFEAPTKELQTFFITRVGSEVNLANIAALDVVGVETLRLGLRSDTLLHFDLERQHLEEVAANA